MVIGSLFAGIGGFDLAARWMGWRTAWFSEVDPYASRVLAHHWPGVPNHGDIRAMDFTQVEPVDMLCGGFPCQDISNAGKRRGIEGERSGLWSEYARAVGDLRPAYVVVENVAALLGRGLERVLGDLAALGYDAEWTVLSAADVGAPHLRERLWIVAYPSNDGTGWRQQFPQSGEGAGYVADSEIQSGRSRLRADEPRGIGRGRPGNRGGACPVPHAILAGLEGDVGEIMARADFWRSDANPAGPDRWAAEPDVGRVAHGIPKRVDRLRGLGNAIVPQCAFVIFQRIAAVMARAAAPERVA